MEPNIFLGEGWKSYLGLRETIIGCGGVIAEEMCSIIFSDRADHFEGIALFISPEGNGLYKESDLESFASELYGKIIRDLPGEISSVPCREESDGKMNFPIITCDFVIGTRKTSAETIISDSSFPSALLKIFPGEKIVDGEKRIFKASRSVELRRKIQIFIFPSGVVANRAVTSLCPSNRKWMYKAEMAAIPGFTGPKEWEPKPVKRGGFWERIIKRRTRWATVTAL